MAEMRFPEQRTEARREEFRSSLIRYTEQLKNGEGDDITLDAWINKAMSGQADGVTHAFLLLEEFAGACFSIRDVGNLAWDHFPEHRIVAVFPTDDDLKQYMNSNNISDKKQVP